jgi:cell fate regulator YaaT (PSP1 superfamily)
MADNPDKSIDLKGGRAKSYDPPRRGHKIKREDSQKVYDLPCQRTVNVRLRFGGRVQTYDCGEHQLDIGDWVVIKDNEVLRMGLVTTKPIIWPANQTKSVMLPADRRLVRPATQEDLARQAENQLVERDGFRYCQQCIINQKLVMKLVAVEVTFDNFKTIFYYTADDRVDFRLLVKELVSRFRTRIEMRQIGVRQESLMLGGMGVCGRPYCCSGFMCNFNPVSVKMAKEQNISLNTVKISGVCSRLMCCLAFESSIPKRRRGQDDRRPEDEPAEAPDVPAEAGPDAGRRDQGGPDTGRRDQGGPDGSRREESRARDRGHDDSFRIESPEPPEASLTFRSESRPREESLFPRPENRPRVRVRKDQFRIEDEAPPRKSPPPSGSPPPGVPAFVESVVVETAFAGAGPAGTEFLETEIVETEIFATSSPAAAFEKNERPDAPVELDETDVGREERGESDDYDDSENYDDPDGSDGSEYAPETDYSSARYPDSTDALEAMMFSADGEPRDKDPDEGFPDDGSAAIVVAAGGNGPGKGRERARFFTKKKRPSKGRKNGGGRPPGRPDPPAVG